jgi:hypothetical protein
VAGTKEGRGTCRLEAPAGRSDERQSTCLGGLRALGKQG